MLPIRVLLLAPRTGSSGPADYADELVEALRPHVAEIVELRHGAPGEDGWADVRRWRREVRRLLAQEDSQPGALPTVVHAELSGGAVSGFWALAAAGSAPRTATVHDAPRAVWYPFRTRAVARSRILSAALHRGLGRPARLLERRLMRGVRTVALSTGGVEAIEALGDLEPATAGRLFLPAAPPIPPATERPLAVGLFGHVYRGKGFDQLAAIRRHLDPDIAIRVAGRGTEELPPLDGVEVLGTLGDDELAGFFGSIRLLLLPYRRVPIGGVEPVPASLAHLTAIAFGTPALALPSPQMVALSEEGGVLLSADSIGGLADLAARVVTDPDLLQRSVDAAASYARGWTPDAAVRPYLDLWGRA